MWMMIDPARVNVSAWVGLGGRLTRVDSLQVRPIQTSLGTRQTPGPRKYNQSHITPFHPTNHQSSVTAEAPVQ